MHTQCWRNSADDERRSPVRTMACTTTVRGGVWTAATNGVAFDSYRAEARTQEAKAWSAVWGFAASATFALGRHGPEDALLLCEYWVENMTYLFFFSRDEGIDFTFTDNFLASVPETPALQALRTRAVGHTARRAHELLALRPIGPRGIGGYHLFQLAKKGGEKCGQHKTLKRAIQSGATCCHVSGQGFGVVGAFFWCGARCGFWTA